MLLGILSPCRLVVTMWLSYAALPDPNPDLPHSREAASAVLTAVQHGANCFEQAAEIASFRDIGIEAVVFELAGCFLGARGEGDRRAIHAALAQLVQRCDAIHSSHANIKNDQIGRI